MANRLTDAQLRNQRAQALRAARRLERKVDTQLEKMERKFDRAIENKDKITIRLALGIGDDFRLFVELVGEFQKGLADLLNIFMSGR